MVTENSFVRVRFAPAPTGLMHLGNIRAALINYLFARQKNGTFILRIEDTDVDRNFDKDARQIIAHLSWLGLSYDEGPHKEGSYGPYFQSQRIELYAQYLEQLKNKGCIYRCFCTPQELEKKRARQIALKMAPRYDRTCTSLPSTDVERLLADGFAFVWRFKLDHSQTVTIHDLARGDITFELKNFSDFPLTRSDGSFTFLFANFVDDMLMKITHVFRGEDHLSNTANQAALYHAFATPFPTYWHMPILCNSAGQKLSKRDFGFSINDLQTGGFLPEAINNYLAVLGGSFKQEIVAPEDLPNAINFNNIRASGQITYDEQRLRWFNHEWIQRLKINDLAQRYRPFLLDAYPDISIKDEELEQLLTQIKPEMHTLLDANNILQFYFDTPQPSAGELEACLSKTDRNASLQVIHSSLELQSADDIIAHIKQMCIQQSLSLKALMSFMRLALTGNVIGLGVGQLINMLGIEQTQIRVKAALDRL